MLRLGLLRPPYYLCAASFFSTRRFRSRQHVILVTLCPQRRPLISVHSIVAEVSVRRLDYDKEAPEGKETS